MFSYGALTSKLPNKQSLIFHMKSDVSQSVLLHPHLELIASKVIMEEKAGGFCGIFLRAIRHFCLQLITRTQHQEARKVYKHFNIQLTSTASVTVTFCILLLGQSFQMTTSCPSLPYSGPKLLN